MNIDNKEIERKWLIRNIPTEIIKNIKPLELSQYYICLSPHIRLRKADDRYYMTIKETRDDEDLVRDEYEFDISKDIYDRFIDKKLGIILHKSRYNIKYNDKHIIELDIFKEDYEGLVYAEVEFIDKNDAMNFKAPSWFDKELTGIKKYNNMSLSIDKLDIKEIYG